MFIDKQIAATGIPANRKVAKRCGTTKEKSLSCPHYLAFSELKEYIIDLYRPISGVVAFPAVKAYKKSKAVSQ
jgi:hypothetical protein